jgi:hypothetical protein
MYLKGAKGKPEKNAQGFKYNYKKRAIWFIRQTFKNDHYGEGGKFIRFKTSFPLPKVIDA